MIKRKSKHEFRVSVPLEKPITNDDILDMRKWCTETFGDGGRHKRCKWRYGWLDRNVDSFYFRTEKDALFFTLRWI